MHQQAFDEGVHRVLSISIGPPAAASAKKLPRLSGAVLLGRDRTRPGSARQRELKRFSFRFGAIR
jgi:hypothetical protein